MTGTRWILLGLSALAFVLAVVTSLFGKVLILPAESFSRACSNLALIAIALALVHTERNRHPGSR